MKKSDLKSGMIIETNDGKRGIVILGTKNGDIVVSPDNGDYAKAWFPLDIVNNNFIFNRNKISKRKFIKRIWENTSNAYFLNLKYVGKLIFEKESLYEVDTIVKIISGGNGAYGCSGYGYITKDELNNGTDSSGINVNISGKIWGLGINYELEILE